MPAGVLIRQCGDGPCTMAPYLQRQITELAGTRSGRHQHWCSAHAACNMAVTPPLSTSHMLSHDCCLTPPC